MHPDQKCISDVNIYNINLNVIKIIIKYIFILYAFGIMGVDIFFLYSRSTLTKTIRENEALC
jgi:hypothetical protein